MWKGHPFKKLTKKLVQHSGRNNEGTITVYNKGGRQKRLYRIIDFERSLWNIIGIIKRKEYDPYRTAPICLVCFNNGLFAYSLAFVSGEVGSTILNGVVIPNIFGFTKPVNFIPEGFRLFNLELKQYTKSKLIRSAGDSAVILTSSNMQNNTINIKLASDKIIGIKKFNLTTLGRVSNLYHNLRQYKKAGILRALGIRPHVRGVAKNPVDHPHGGRTSGGRCSVSRWAWITKCARKKK